MWHLSSVWLNGSGGVKLAFFLSGMETCFLIILNKLIAHQTRDQTCLTFGDYLNWQDRLQGLDTMSLSNVKLFLKSFHVRSDKDFPGIYGQIIEIQVKLCESWYKRCEFIANITDRALLQSESPLWQDAGVDFTLLDEAIEDYHALTNAIAAIKEMPQDQKAQDCYNLLVAEFNFGLANFYMLRYRHALDPAVWESAERYIKAALSCDPSTMSEELQERSTRNHLKYKNYWGILLEYRDPEKSIKVGGELVAGWDELCQQKGDQINWQTPFPGRARMNLAERILNLYETERKPDEASGVVKAGPYVIDKAMLGEALGHVTQAKAYFDLYPEIYTHEVTNSNRLRSEIEALLG